VLNKYIICVLLVFSFAGGMLVTSLRRPKAVHAGFAPPPNSLLVCGISDHPCVLYAVSYHQPTNAFADGAGEGFTDYEKKTISIASSSDRFQNVKVLEHEVYHAVLFEHGIRDTETWDLHSWIYLSEGPFTMFLHDNPAFVQYVMNGYRSPGP